MLRVIPVNESLDILEFQLLLLKKASFSTVCPGWSGTDSAGGRTNQRPQRSWELLRHGGLGGLGAAPAF